MVGYPGDMAVAQATNGAVAPSREPARRQVVVAVHQDGFAQRELLAGFCSEAHRFGGWDLHYLPRLGWDVELAKAGLPWRPDGILLYSESRDVVSAVQSYGIPCVDMGDGPLRLVLPFYDEESVGRKAAEHLRACGYPHFACIGLDNWGDDPRSKGFTAVIDDQGGRIERLGVLLDDLDLPACWNRIMEWMVSLPLPCGVFAITDRIAQVVASVATRLGLRLPEEIGLVGVDGDPVLSRLSPVPLSSVRMPYQDNGVWAARVLARMMDGEKPGRPGMRLPSGELVVQRSSDRRCHTDPLVTAANAWIRDHLAGSPGIGEIADALQIGRRTLERRFQAVTGSSVLSEIQRQRIDMGRLLLRRGTGVQETARALGLTPNRFISWFRHTQGVTPKTYQELWRITAAAVD